MTEYQDVIEVTNKVIFGDEEEHEVEMFFNDGYAISIDHKYGMSYPTVDVVMRNKQLTKEVEEYTGREVGDPYDVALKYGVLFKLPEVDDWAEKRHDILLDLLDDRQLEEYERMSACLDAEGD